MNTHLSIFSGILVVFVAFQLSGQSISTSEKSKIISEINEAFKKNIEAGEKLDVKGIMAQTDDSQKATFIDNGTYYETFEDRMVPFKKGINGIQSQELEIAKKKITILSDDTVLLSAQGSYAATLTDGRIINGNFAWTLIYSKIRNEWKVIHTHMSIPGK